jgi:hypothetical protein
MTGNHAPSYWDTLVLFHCSGLPMIASWWLIARSKELRRWYVLIPLLLGTVSYLWIVLAIARPMALGAYYSNARYLIIEMNSLVALLAGLAAFARFKTLDGLLTGFGCLLVTLAWVVIGVANSVA